jgi:hypothetical protein
MIDTDFCDLFPYFDITNSQTAISNIIGNQLTKIWLNDINPPLVHNEKAQRRRKGSSLFGVRWSAWLGAIGYYSQPES